MNLSYFLRSLSASGGQRPSGPAPLAETITFLSSLAILGSYSYYFNSIPGCLPRRSPEDEGGLHPAILRRLRLTYFVRLWRATALRACSPSSLLLEDKHVNLSYFFRSLRGCTPQRTDFVGPTPLAETITFLSSLAILGSYSYDFNSSPGCLPRRSPEADNGIQRES